MTQSTDRWMGWVSLGEEDDTGTCKTAFKIIKGIKREILAAGGLASMARLTQDQVFYYAETYQWDSWHSFFKTQPWFNRVWTVGKLSRSPIVGASLEQSSQSGLLRFINHPYLSRVARQICWSQILPQRQLSSVYGIRFWRCRLNFQLHEPPASCRLTERKNTIDTIPDCVQSDFDIETS